MQKKCWGIIFLITFTLACQSKSHLQKAIEASADKDYAVAIAEYQKYFEESLEYNQKEVLKNPAAALSNPYYYNLMIGDCYLSLKNYEEAEKNYLLASENGVERELVIDRFKLLAKNFEEDNNLDQALSILEKYQELDPDSFEIAIDSLHKRIIELKDSKITSKITVEP